MKRHPMYSCQECGWLFYATAAAERAAFGDDGCPGCGGCDVDVYVGPRRSIMEQLSEGRGE